MLNHIVIMGRLVRDPELRRTAGGTAVASFRLAVDRDFGNKETGEREADFIDVVAWRQTGEFVSQHFTKGRMAVVSGRLQIRTWTDKDGQKRTAAEVVADNVYFGDSRRNGDGGRPMTAPTGCGDGGRPIHMNGTGDRPTGYGGTGAYHSTGGPVNFQALSSTGGTGEFQVLDGDDGDLPF